MLNRRAATLVELLVALALAGVVLGTAMSSVLRQQRTHERIRAVSGADAQLRAATSVVAAQLSLLDPAAGDLALGQADDTALQFRAAVAVSLACGRSNGSVTLLPDSAGTPSFAGSASQPRSGDSLWWLGDSAWLGTRIGSVVREATSCTVPMSASGSALRLSLVGSGDSVPVGAALRVTRQTRYALYRSSDGSWQLGFREWNDAGASFSAPQPVAGPFLLRSGGRRSGFRYFDEGGRELATAGRAMDVTRVARIRITMQSLVAVREGSQDSVRTDSVDVALHRAPEP